MNISKILKNVNDAHSHIAHAPDFIINVRERLTPFRICLNYLNKIM